MAAGCGSAAAPTAASTAPPTVPDTAAPPTGSSTAPAATTIPLDCSDASLAGYDFIGSMHTVVPSGQPINATVTLHGDALCTGGHGEADVTLTNNGPVIEHVQNPQLVLSGGAAKWTLQEWPPLNLAAGESRTLAASFPVPGVNPGSYGLFLYGYDGYTNVTVEGPTVCATSDLTAVGVIGGEAMSNLRTDITITNVGNHPCLLPDPNIIQGLNPPEEPTQLAFSKGTYFGDPPPLASHVLPVGGQAVLWVGTITGCVETQPPKPWSGLRLSFTSTPSFELTVLDVAVVSDPPCGNLSISSYGRVTPQAG